jgi:hypothetical protein
VATLRGAASVATLTQPEPDWLDVTAYQDIVAWLDVKRFTPSPGTNTTLAYQTAPSKDDALFFNMTAPLVVANGVTTTVMLKDAVAAGMAPCGKWFRWQILVSGAVAWDLTFRIWLAVNRIGNRVAMSEPKTLGDLDQEGNQYAYGTAATGWQQNSSSSSGIGYGSGPNKAGSGYVPTSGSSPGQSGQNPKIPLPGK